MKNKMDTFLADSSQDSCAGDITTSTPETVITRFSFLQSPAEETPSLLTLFPDTSSSESHLIQQEPVQPRTFIETRELRSPQRRSRRGTGRHKRLFEDILSVTDEHPLISSIDVHSSEGRLPQSSRPLLSKASIPSPISPQRMSSRSSYPAIRTSNRNKSESHSQTSPMQIVSHPRISLPISLKTPPPRMYTATEWKTDTTSRLPAPTMSPTKIAMPSSHLSSTSESSATPIFGEVEVESEGGKFPQTSSPTTLSPPRVIKIPERRVTHQSELSFFGMEDKTAPEDHEQIEISWFHRPLILNSSSSSPTPQQEIQQPRKNVHLKLLQSPLRQSRRSTAGYSRLSEDIVLSEGSSDDGKTYSKPLVTSKIEIDPFLVGPLIVQMALRENQRLDDELKENAKSMYWLKQQDQPCPCDVRHHPSWWSLQTIDNVHRYSFLLDCRDLQLKTERIIAGNSRNTVVVYDVPMENGHPWKMKAEQVLRYVDVETGVGDQTAYNVQHYIQPCDRKVFLVVSSHRVVGLVVAEPQKTAHRVLHETQSYRDLEEQAVPVRVGINWLWVHISMRRLHLATLLCRLVRELFYEGESLKMEDLAFNNISDAGVAFAKNFLKTFRVPLYDGKTGIKF